MKRFLAATGLFVVIVFVSAAEAININVAEVQNGVAFVDGGKAAANATITWEGGNVTTANKNGGFKFSGIVPADCAGTLSDGVTTIEVVVLDCTPVSVAPAPVPRTGQVTCYDTSGATVNCAGTGQDGELQEGVAWPNPRFTDNGNGTITDNLTGLIWLKNANCPPIGIINWATALAYVVSLNTDGTMNGNNCGDTSNGGNHQTDWRLPNIRELFSLVDFAFHGPALSNAAGTGQATGNDPFTNFAAPTYHYSSTTFESAPTIVWAVQFSEGRTDFAGKTGNGLVLPVRGP
jgi:hypothetical protein